MDLTPKDYANFIILFGTSTIQVEQENKSDDTDRIYNLDLDSHTLLNIEQHLRLHIQNKSLNQLHGAITYVTDDD